MLGLRISGGESLFPGAIPARCVPTAGPRAGPGGPWSTVPPTAGQNEARAERWPTWWGLQRAGQAAASADGAAGQESSGWAGGLEKPWRKAGSAWLPWAVRGAGPPRRGQRDKEIHSLQRQNFQRDSRLSEERSLREVLRDRSPESVQQEFLVRLKNLSENLIVISISDARTQLKHGAGPHLKMKTSCPSLPTPSPAPQGHLLSGCFWCFLGGVYQSYTVVAPR